MHQRIVENLERQLEESKAEVKRLADEVLPTLMDTVGVKDFTLDTDDRLVRGQHVYTSIAKANMPQAVEWLENNNFGSIVKSEITIPIEKGDHEGRALIETLLCKARIDYVLASNIHHSTLKAFGKQSVEVGRALPEAIAVHIQPHVELIPPRSPKGKGV